MKFAFLIPLAALVVAGTGHAQTKIFRCGNSYTNNAAEAAARNCKPIEGGNVTVVEGTRVNPNAAVRVATTTSPQAVQQKLDAAEQRNRDADARQVLEAELKKAEARQAELLAEYNNGEPDKQGAEARNYQKYLDRVAELKAGIARNENDIAGLRRELGRMPASK